MARCTGSDSCTSRLPQTTSTDNVPDICSSKKRTEVCLLLFTEFYVESIYPTVEMLYVGINEENSLPVHFLGGNSCSRRANTPSLHYEITYKQPLQDVMKM